MRSLVLTVLLGLGAPSALGLAALGCLDFTPLAPPTVDAGSSPDGSTAPPACFACAERDDDAGGCSAEFGQCNMLDRCRDTVACVVGQCFDPNANITMCLAGCESEGGITGSSGPANATFASFLQCMAQHCQSVCLP